MLAWVGSTTAGHTKRAFSPRPPLGSHLPRVRSRPKPGLTTNAIVMIGYAVGTPAGPQYWKAQYQPRNRVPWIILAACWAASALLLLATRWWLARENARREREGPDGRYDDVYVTETLADGSVVEKKVDKVRVCSDSSRVLGTNAGGRTGVLGPHRYPEPRLPLRALNARAPLDDARYDIQRICLFVFALLCFTA